MTEKKIHPEDTIEIPGFKSFLINGFRLFFKFLDLLLLTFRNNYIPLAVGALAGGLFGLLLHNVNRKNFNVSMVVEYTVLDKRAYNDVLDQFETLIRTRSFETMASDLKVSSMVTENINTIEGLTMDDRPLIKDTSSYPFFKISLGLKSPFAVDSLESALLDYFNQLPYLRKLKDDQVKVYTGQLAYADAEALRLDSLKAAYVRSLGAAKPGSGIYISEADPSNLYGKSYQLDTMRASIQNWLNGKSQPMLLVKGFRATKTPQSLSAPASIALCVLVGFAIALIFSLLKEINVRINGA